MSMANNVNVQIFVESRYRVNRKKIKKLAQEIIMREGVVGEVEVSIAIVGNRKMHELNLKYRGLDKTTNVLSFSQMDGEPTVMPPTDKLVLGDVVISYPEVIEEASRENVLVDDKICFWVEHGLMHLLGKHHE